MLNTTAMLVIIIAHHRRHVIINTFKNESYKIVLIIIYKTKIIPTEIQFNFALLNYLLLFFIIYS